MASFSGNFLVLGEHAFRAVTFNTHGGCGDMLLYDHDRFRGKQMAMRRALTSFDVACLQELHSDHLEAQHFEDTWAHSHFTFWFHGEERNRGGNAISIKRSWLRSFEYAFAVKCTREDAV